MASELTIRCDNRLSAVRSVSSPPAIGLSSEAMPVLCTLSAALNTGATVWLVARPVAVETGDALFACQLSQVGATLVYSGSLSPSTVAAVAHLGSEASTEITVELVEVWTASGMTHRRTLAMFDTTILRSVYGGTYSDETIAKALTAVTDCAAYADTITGLVAVEQAARIAGDEQLYDTISLLTGNVATKMDKIVAPEGNFVLANDPAGNAKPTTVTEGTLEANLPSAALAKLISAASSSCRLFGGEITYYSGSLILVAAGGGVSKSGTATLQDIPHVIGDGQSSAVEYVEWPTTAIALQDGYNIVYWDASAGAITSCLREDMASVFDFTRDFAVGSAYLDMTAGTKTFRQCGMDGWNFPRRVQMFGEERFPVERASGLMVSCPSERFIAMTAGVIWTELVNRFPINGFDSRFTDKFTTWAREAKEGEPETWYSISEVEQIDAINYNNHFVAGGLSELTANRYGVHWIYVVHDSSVHVVYGTGDYTLAQAQNATPPTILPGLIAAYATLVGKAIVKKGAATLTSIQSPFVTSLGLATVNEHNDFGGIQGGSAGEYYHLTAAQVSAVNGAVRHNTAQELSSAAKDQANANIATGFKPSLLAKHEAKALMRAALVESGQAQRLIMLSSTYVASLQIPTGTTEPTLLAPLTTVAGSAGLQYSGANNHHALYKFTYAFGNNGTPGAGVGTLRIGGYLHTTAQIPCVFADGTFSALTLTLADSSKIVIRTATASNGREYIWLKTAYGNGSTRPVYIYDYATNEWKLLVTLQTTSTSFYPLSFGFVLGTGYVNCKVYHDNINGSIVYPGTINISDIF